MENFENAVKKKSVMEPQIANVEGKELRRRIVHF